MGVIEDFLPYSNLCGIFAITANINTKEELQKIHDALLVAASVAPPCFD
jgi:hypothetical protein